MSPQGTGYPMKKPAASYWKSKTLHEMARKEWEDLCDGCRICCLEKIEDRKTGIISLTGVSCEFLNTETCRCLIYDARGFANPDCIELSPERIPELNWLPDTCAYRCIAEGRELAWWHPLVSGDPNTVHEAGVSIRKKVVSGRHIHPKEFRQHIINTVDQGGKGPLPTFDPIPPKRANDV